MVKSVVKPLKMGFLRERIVPKKSVFTRDFGVFCFEIPCGRCLAPKRRALPTAPHPEVCKIFDFRSISVSGQICGQASFQGAFSFVWMCEKVSIYKAFRRFRSRLNSESVTRSQSTRATVSAQPKCLRTHLDLYSIFRTYILYHEISSLSTFFCKILRFFVHLFFCAVTVSRFVSIHNCTRNIS